MMDSKPSVPMTPNVSAVHTLSSAERRWASLRNAVEPSRRALLEHPIYEAVSSLERLRVFMGTHVFAVWDFMCLAKRLQRDLTSLDVLWRPPSAPDMAHFINGIILGEESDVGPDGAPLSHLELYLGAMDEVGADTRPIRRFLDLVARGVSLDVALEASGAPRHARSFVRHTLRWVTEGETIEVLAAFLFGREDLIPDMFQRLLPRWRDVGETTKFTYYVQRHIEVDGGDHGPAARRAFCRLAGDETRAWVAAERAAHESIAARIALWDGVLTGLPSD